MATCWHCQGDIAAVVPGATRRVGEAAGLCEECRYVRSRCIRARARQDLTARAAWDARRATRWTPGGAR